MNPADKYIPHDIQEGVREAGVKSLPLWYVGRPNGYKAKPLSSGLGQVVAEARERANLGPVEYVEPGELHDELEALVAEITAEDATGEPPSSAA